MPLPWARECPPTTWDSVSLDRPFSNFDYIGRHFPCVWPLRRVFSQVRAHGARSMVVECLDAAQARDLSEENEDIQKRFTKPVESRVCRLSFFETPLPNKQALRKVQDEDFLGYAIVKQDSVADVVSVSRIYESVVAPSRRDNNFVRGLQQRASRVADRSFDISGYLYTQQNGWTNCCAHVACRTVAARFHPNHDMTYREMNDLPGVDINHTSKTAEKGLSKDTMVKILESAGARCIVADYRKPRPGFDPPPFQKYLYGSVESGYPAILFFRTLMGSSPPYHAIPVFGHTFNEDMWVPIAEWSYFVVGAGTRYVPSEQWLSTFVAHDDNLGSNYCIPRHFLHAKRLCDNWPGGSRPCQTESDCVAYVIATLPKNVKVNPIDAEVIGADYLFRIRKEVASSNAWWSRLEDYAGQNKLVLRPFLLTALEYAQHLGSMSDWDHGTIPENLRAWVEQFSDRPLWMVELSVPELFSTNRRKVGEVLLFADRSPGTSRDFRNFLLARIPGYFVFFTGGDFNTPEFSLVPSPVRGHVSLFGCQDETP